MALDGESLARRRELYSLERMSLGWPWHAPKHAAGLAVELINWATPPAADDDTPEIVDARQMIVLAMSYVTAFANGTPINVPTNWGTPDDHPMTRLYWYAPELGKCTVGACNAVAEAIRFNVVEPTRKKVSGLQKFTTPSREVNLLCHRWRAAGTATQHAVEFLRKYATDNPTVGEIDGAGGGILNRIGFTLAYNAAQPTEEITGRMFHWRVRDALKGKPLPPELDANLRPAFEAAWAAAEYQFAYSLLADLDTLVESYA